jgi:hypothetical protein
VQDGHKMFVGSQSLRKLELDHRREVGVIVDDKKAIAAATRVFEADWALTATGRAEAAESAAPDKIEEKELDEVGVSA